MNRIKTGLVFSGIIGIVISMFMAFAPAPQEEKVTFVIIETNMGNMKFKLHNETPLHRDNFLKLINESYFDSLLFHRVIYQFMIQGGDPESRGAKEGKVLGNGGPSYQIPAEFHSDLFHQKGALAAAREGDDVNPDMNSSGSQFYIVQGRIFDSLTLEALQARRKQQYRSMEFKRYMNRPENEELYFQYMQAMKSGDRLTGEDIMNKTNPIIDSILVKYEYSPQQIEAYTTVGGTPHLDNAYTVFGQMVEGFEVLDEIAKVTTDRNDRPMNDVVMSIKVYEEPLLEESEEEPTQK